MTTIYEGDSITQLAQFIKQTGYNKPVDFLIATVTKAPPELEIKLDVDGLTLTKDSLIVSRNLTRHQRIIAIDYKHPQTVELGDKTVSTASSRNDIGQAPYIPYETFSMQYATMQFEDVLKVGDRVIVAELSEDMTYIVLDVAHTY